VMWFSEDMFDDSAWGQKGRSRPQAGA